MFTTMEIFDPSVLYTDRPVKFRIYKPNEVSKWRFGLVQHVEYDRVVVVHSVAKSTPEREFISVNDIKTGKTEIELLG